MTVREFIEKIQENFSNVLDNNIAFVVADNDDGFSMRLIDFQVSDYNGIENPELSFIITRG